MKVLSLVWKNFISTIKSHNEGYLSTENVVSSGINIHSLRDPKKKLGAKKCN